MKIATIIGTRPEIIRLSRVMAALDSHVDHIVIHTGQNYDHELNQVFFDELELRKPDHFLEAAGSNVAETIGLVISRTDEVLPKIRPDAVLILGDTNSCLAAIAAKRRKIPVFHMEAGNRCFDQRVPEEINRKIVDHIADINMPYSDISRDYLLREGIAPDRVIKTGSPMFEVLNHYRQKIESSDILQRLSLQKNGYFLVSAHREENIDDPNQFQKLMQVLNGLAETYELPVVVSTHPRTRKTIDSAASCVHSHVRFLKPFGYLDYNHLQTAARVTLSDSGTITEESSILNFPAINIRNAHERPEGMEEAAVIMTGLEWPRILTAMNVVETQPRGGERLFPIVADYNVANVSEKVVRIILSYTDYINRTVWKKPI